MIFRLLALVALPLFAWWIVSPLRRKYALTQRQFTLLFILVVAMLTVIGLILIGRLPVHFILAPLGVAATFLLRSLPFLLRLMPLWQMFRSRFRVPGYGAARQDSGRQSTIRTDWFSMSLDHDTGDMDGEVLQGRFSGRRLSSLSLSELIELGSEAGGDTDSVQLLEAYLDRSHPQWREQGGQKSSGQKGAADESVMTRELALEILGLSEPVDRDAVIKAHRRLMQRMHPDRGGSDYFAKKINGAKDYLLGNP